MYSLITKEIRQFFSGLSGYLILFLFYTLTALVLFVVQNPFNILDIGSSSLEGFFSFAPFAFLFLIPAICMKSFSEEKKTGTLEVLLSRPLTSMQITLSKYLSCFVFFALSLLPVFIYYYTVFMLASPVGNIDTSAFIGSLIGLLFLGAAYIAISVFVSSLSDSQVLSFIVSVVCCVIFYLGFDAIAGIVGEGSVSVFIAGLGMREHFTSLSRGVIDFGDVIYLASIAVLFIALTAEILKPVKRISSPLLIIAGVIIINIVFSFFTLRLDFTSDKRYTLKNTTKEILKEIKEPIYIRVYLTGNLPAGFTRLEKSIDEMLSEFSRYNKNLRYQFVDIYADENSAQGGSSEQSKAQMRFLIENGFEPTQLEVKTKEGMMRRLIFPYAEIRYNGSLVPVKLLVDQVGRSADQTLHHSTENIEMQLIKGIRALISENIPSIAFLTGNGEWTYTQTESIGRTLSEYYNVRRASIEEGLFYRDTNGADGGIDGAVGAVGAVRNKYDALISAHPTRAFSQEQKFILDQYLMNGGSILWFIDQSDVTLDTLRSVSQANAIPLSLGLEDMFFRYGFRISNNIILDLNCAYSPVITSNIGGRPQTEFLPNLYRPILKTSVVGGLEATASSAANVRSVVTSFAASIDTISSGATKTPVLFTSEYTKKIPLPAVVSADIMYDRTNPSSFRQGVLIAGLFLHGRFASAFPLVKPSIPDSVVMPAYRSRIDSGRMFVFSDGEIVRNEVNQRQGIVYPLGYDPYTNAFFDNEKLVVEAVHTALAREELLELGTRTMTMRLLDKTAVLQKKSTWVTIVFAFSYGVLLLLALWMSAVNRRNKQ